jgi:hypothetical protein
MRTMLTWWTFVAQTPREIAERGRTDEWATSGRMKVRVSTATSLVRLSNPNPAS